MSDLLSVREAQDQILGKFHPLPAEHVSIDNGLGRVLAETVVSPGDYPPFDNSSMDGYAVVAQDTGTASPQSPVTLQVVGDIPAGTNPSFTIRSGQAARIMTGAMLPPGANAVVPVEDTDQPHGEPGLALPEQVVILHPAIPGQALRPRGMDLTPGMPLLLPGTRLRPQEVGLLAMLGVSEISVTRKPRIVIFSSGDELLPPGAPPSPGKIYDANQFTLTGLLTGAGAEVTRLGIAPDDPAEISAFLHAAADLAPDIILTSAGVSVGAFDFIRDLVEQEGRITFWKVNMRPGKPLAFGEYRGIPFIGLPGNPVSAFVGCLVFVQPVIRKLAGLTTLFPPSHPVTLQEKIESDGRESYLRAMIREVDGVSTATLTGHQGSGNLFSLVQSNALLIVPSGVKSLPAGSRLNAWFYNEVE